MSAQICVVHLARAANGPAPLADFLASYKKHAAGLDHDLLLVLKGFEAGLPQHYENLLSGVAHRRRFIPDRGFDIDAYFDTVKAHEATWYCFLNSFSVILADGWLHKLHAALEERGAGMVGATGSWQSVLSHYSDNIAVPAAYQAGYPGWKRLLLTCFPSVRRLWPPIRRWLRRGKFEPFPNHHLRTNAFLIRRETALMLNVAPMRRKFDAYLFESGRHGLTRQILGMGKPVFVVGRDGKAYDMADWHLSNTFWRGNQENLLVADNQTRKYEASDMPVRTMYSSFAWGPAADPGHK
jgi:hypothetical protein